MAEQMAYFNYPAQHTINSSDTFFPVQVQPSASDSAQTPPSPISYSKPRLSRSSTHSVSTTQPKSAVKTHKSKSSRRSSALSHSLSQRSGSNGASVQFRRERERQLANTPRDHLIQLTVSKEYESREAKHLLTTALMQLESHRERLTLEQEMRRALEEEKREQGVKTTKAIIDTQKEAMSAKEEVRRFQLQLDNAQRELRKAGEAIQHVKSEKADLERDLVKARSTARTFKEQAILLQAREEGRREGFEEGLRQGRALHGVVDLTSMTPAQPAANEKKKPSSLGPSTSYHNNERRQHSSSFETEMEREDLHKIGEKEILRLRLQLAEVERERDLERQKNKEANQEKKRLLEEAERLKKARVEESAKRDGREKKIMKELQAKDNRLREEAYKSAQERGGLTTQLEQVEGEKEALAMELKREKDKAEKDKEDAERRVQEERRERDKDKEANNAATIAAAVAAATSVAVGASNAASSSKQNYLENQPIKYIPMPPPPIHVNPPTSGPVPRTMSVGSGSIPRGHPRRFSVGSTSSTISTTLEVLQPPAGTSPEDRLSVIHEVDDAGSSSHSPYPAWMSKPPAWPQPTFPHVPHGNGSTMPHGPSNPNLLQPGGSMPYNTTIGKQLNQSLSTIDIQIEPPSRPPSSIDLQEVDGGFLSPNARLVSLPSQQETPLPIRPRNDPDSSVAPISNSPVIPGVTVPVPQPPRHIPAGSVGHFPPGFVPQSITDSRGVSTPISWPSGVPLPPVMPSGGPPSSLPKSTPFYGNPLNKDRKQEDMVKLPAHGPVPNFVSPGMRSNGAVSMTPGMSTRDLPGSGAPALSNVGARSGVSIYGPPATPATPWGLPSGPATPGPLPASAPNPEEEDEEENDLDPQTAHNTRLNAVIGRVEGGYGQQALGGRGFNGNNGWR